MKKLTLVITFLVFVLLIAQQAFAQTAEGASALANPIAIKYIAYFFALGIAVFAGTTAQSKAASVALEGIARNPAAADKLQTPMILALALMESLVIFALISTFLI